MQLSGFTYVAAYESDLEVDIVDEFIQFHKLLKTQVGKPVYNRTKAV